MNYSDYITQETTRRERERQLTARYNQKPDSKKLQNVFRSEKITGYKVNNLEAAGVVVFFVIMVIIYLILK